jgi:hypothetical protein
LKNVKPCIFNITDTVFKKLTEKGKCYKTKKIEYPKMSYIIQAILFGIIYAFIEEKYIVEKTHATLNNLFSPYRILYFLMFLTATFTINIELWIAYFLISMSVEDIFYWIIAGKKPYQWTWYYIVIDGIPIIDVIEIIIAIVLLIMA